MKKAFKKFNPVEETEPTLKVLYWFFAHPYTPIGLNDLTEAVGISKTTANKIVRRFQHEGFLIVEELGKTWRITCNTQHKYNKTIKISFNIGLVYSSGIINKITEKIPNARAIVLFGSYRKGDNTEKSDLDIAVEVMNNEEMKIIDLGFVKMGYKDKVPVKVQVFSRNKVDINMFANIANGVVLFGFLEARP